MTDRYFLFNDEMVRRILSGEKTQTRRPLLDAQRRTPPAGAEFVKYHWSVPAACFSVPNMDGPMHWSARLPAAPGDVLIGRECWAWSGDVSVPELERVPMGEVWYRATPVSDHGGVRWRPSIHMPRWAARIVRPITRVRVERVQDISEADAIAEGFERQVQGMLEGLPLPGEGEHCDCGDADCPMSARMEFACAWNTIYADRGLGWDFNPWVVVVEFGRATV